jgi:predicted N-formylglutamate amidohydrolase
MRQISDGHPIPFNYGLSSSDRQERIDRYYRPYRRAVEDGVRDAIARAGRCVHLCVHTFTPVLADRVRGNDIGLLHDPAWGIERAACADIRRWLAANTHHVVWFNRPYSGTADGILPALRRQNEPAEFAGLELEINQRYAGDAAALRAIADHIADALRAARSLTVTGSPRR